MKDKIYMTVISLLLLLEMECRHTFLYSLMKDHLNIKEDFECQADLPLMSVGHGILNNDNIEDEKRNHQVFIVALTDSGKPEENCIMEPFLKSLHVDFSNLQHIHNDNEIRIYRVDFDEVSKMRTQEKDTFLQAPSLFVVKNRRYHKYNGPLKKENFLAFMNKVVNPYIQLSKQSQINQFMEAGTEYEEYSTLFKSGFVPLGDDFANYKRKHRAILVLHDRNIIPSLMRKFTEAGENLANREDLRIALLNDRGLALNFIKKYKDQINTESKNLLLLKNDDDKYMIMDLEKEPDIDIEEWINKNSLDLLQELDAPHAAKLVDMVKAPTLIIFTEESEKSQKLLDVASDLVQQYYSYLQIVYVKDPNIMELRYKLGITHGHLPAITIVTNKGIIYPLRNEYGDLNPTSLKEYVNHYVTGRIRPLNNDKFLESIDKLMEKRIQRTQIIDVYNFNQTVIDDNERDTFAFFYSSEEDSFPYRRSLEVANFFDTSCQRFQEHEMKTVHCL